MHGSGAREKFRESLSAVMPIMAIVLLLSFSFAPMPTSILLAFIFGGVMLIVGMTLFSLGAEMAMEPMGERLGAKLTKTKKLPLLLVLGFFLGFLITVSEPDLQVLANQVPAIPNNVLIFSVAGGVGLFLIIALLRMLLGIPLKYLFLGFYALVLALAFAAPKDFVAVAFDSGGVTTGPMTVPFIMSFGLGISAIRSDKHAYNDSFGLVALSSIGPIIAVLILSLIYSPSGAAYVPAVIPDISRSVELRDMFLRELPVYLKEVCIALLPIAVFFYIMQLAALKLDRRTVGRISVGLLYTFFGLVIFLTGVNVGFLPAGAYLGRTLAELPYRWIMIPLGMVMGYFIVKAEPAVYVLMKQVEEITDAQIKGSTLQKTLCVGVAVSVGIALTRVLTGISLMWFVIPGYALALGLTFFAPKIFTAVAFDSGGVASGPMTATFLLPFAVGACDALGGNIVTDAFGVVAMVALTPLIAIQILGLVYGHKSKRAANEDRGALTDFGEFDVIEV